MSGVRARIIAFLWLVVVASVGGPVAVAGLTSVSLDRYQPIIDRRPFGSLPAPVAAVVVPAIAAQPPPAARGLRLCAIVDSEHGVRAGLLNTLMRPTKSYFLYIGGSEDGVELLDADFEKEGVLLRQGSDTFWLYMRDQPAAGPHASQAPGFRAAAPPVPATLASTKLSYAERRRQRIDAMRRKAREAQSAASPELSEEVIAQRLQEYQMNLLRQGKTPLNMTLSPEAEEQLIREGVLERVPEGESVEGVME